MKKSTRSYKAARIMYLAAASIIILLFLFTILTYHGVSPRLLQFASMFTGQDLVAKTAFWHLNSGFYSELDHTKFSTTMVKREYADEYLVKLTDGITNITATRDWRDEEGVVYYIGDVQGASYMERYKLPAIRAPESCFGINLADEWLIPPPCTSYRAYATVSTIGVVDSISCAGGGNRGTIMEINLDTSEMHIRSNSYTGERSTYAHPMHTPKFYYSEINNTRNDIPLPADNPALKQKVVKLVQCFDDILARQ